MVLSAAAAVAWASPPTAQPLVQQLQAARSPADRKAAVEALVALDPQPVPELAAILLRTRTSSDADRRALLSAQKFDVPDEKGHFANPARQTEAQEKANDELSWLAPLYKQPASPALSDVLVDLAVIRALAASQTSAAAKAILDFAFTPDGIAYRDECGRFLRRMSPWSLPSLILAAKGWHVDASKRRYARYQLERLDREAPRKALNDATTDDLKVEILNAFAQSKYREAVYAVLDTVDDPSPEVRKAARAAWMEYATGKPHFVPKEKLKLPGGKLTDKPVPLWLDHRELADIAIRRRLEELTGKKPPPLPGLARLGAALLTQYDERRKKRFDQSLKADLTKRTDELFAYYDAQRKQKLDQELDATLAAAKTGPLKDAAERLDSILVQAPDYARRGEMADVYLRYGKELAAAGKWHDAASEFGKANAVAPSGPLAEQAMSLHHEARGHALEQQGKSGADELAHAHEIKTTLGGSPRAADGGSRSWMLGFGIAGGIAGMVLVALGFALRRRGG